MEASWIQAVSSIGAGGAAIVMACLFFKRLKEMEVDRAEERMAINEDRKLEREAYMKSLKEQTDMFNQTIAEMVKQCKK